MIRLKNVSKFYYSKGIIASGFTKVNLDLNVGEFVVITGESGSGKSTLLNIISGLDTYEEGEMYVDGIETSHYTSVEFEEYRKKYIGNIFQSFNLVTSYTVYQNVELILLINGQTKEEIKDKVPKIIEKVGLTEYANTKVSKLSGGQKQRVAIARALAKETSIIVADEPTGNLDSASAIGIVELLRELAEDKLIIVVTHNFEQFEQHATRIIKMHDGKIVEDKIVKEVVEDVHLQEGNYGQISTGDKIKLGIRNTFNIFPKFLLLLIVFIFLTMAVSAQYTSFAKQKFERGKLGMNQYFNNYTSSRIVLKKVDKSAFTQEDYDKLVSTPNIKSVVKEDVLLDTSIFVDREEFGFQGFPMDMVVLDGAVDIGTVPADASEIVIGAQENDYAVSNGEEMIGKEYKITYGDGISNTVKIVGIKYLPKSNRIESGVIYLHPDRIAQVRLAAYQNFSKTSITVNGKVLKASQGSANYRLTPTTNVKPGTVMVSEDLNANYTDSKVTGKDIYAEVTNLYFVDGLNMRVVDTYNKDNFQAKTGIKDFEGHNGEVFMNRDDYIALFNKADFQSTVYVADEKTMDETVKALGEMGYKPLALRDALMTFGAEEITGIVQVPMAIILVVALFFISYFVIRLILKSRSAYFAIVRMLGMSQKNSKRILDIEFLLVITIAYLVFLGIVALTGAGVIGIAFIKDLITFLVLRDYIILYLFIVAMALLISSKFARSMFKDSAMNAYREEA